jgi:hypothetical protein
MLSVTDVACSVSKSISTLVGALQVTGGRGPVKVTMRTPVAVVGGGPADVEVEEAGGAVVVTDGELLLLEQPASAATAAIDAITTTRVRGMTRS